ncbi:MAG: Mo-dependent nitrogenase C-terminal domain-containing protein [Rivularia sp. ALOHA_DT_140]|nr:Mo-dependent nitrogenase C-terminal domain-containing protein [Rivularia sp. ALOHA_DT_140]
MFNSIKPAPQETFNFINFKIPSFRGLNPIRQWLNKLEINNPALAHFICRMVPVQCPFERDICLFGRTIVHIPPMCKLNPLYEEVSGLRFRALCYLADECGEDVGCYC